MRYTDDKGNPIDWDDDNPNQKDYNSPLSKIKEIKYTLNSIKNIDYHDLDCYGLSEDIVNALHEIFFLHKRYPGADTQLECLKMARDWINIEIQARQALVDAENEFNSRYDWKDRFQMMMKQKQEDEENGRNRE